MTVKSNQSGMSPDTAKGEIYPRPERQAVQFCTVPDTGIIVDMEIQMGDPVDSQIIRNFMGEFELACKKRLA